jgi:glucosylceramidase
MKRNGVLLGNTTENNLKDQYLDSNETNYAGQWAQYFVKYIQAFAKLGVTVDSITPQNEPLYSSAGYPTMYMFDYEQGHLIQDYLGPALSTAGLSTNIWAYDHNTGTQLHKPCFDPTVTDIPLPDHAEYPQNVLNIASQHTSAVAWHCYASNIDWSVLTSFHNSNPSVQQYMTECWTPQTDATNWYQAANFTLGPLQNYAAGIIAWTLGTDSSYGPYLPGGCDKCKGLVTILPDGSYTFNLSSYLMAQFSKFMPRGSTVLAGSGSAADHNAPGIRSVATLNPDRSISVVILNTFDNDVVVTLTTQSGQTWSGNVIAKSVVTWVLPASQRLSGIVIPGLGDLPFPVPDYLPIR